MIDRFKHARDSVSDPARSAIPVDPNDGIEFAEIPKALFVGTGGDVHLRCVADAAPVLFRNVPDGSILPIRAAELLATGTTAGDIVALS